MTTGRINQVTLLVSKEKTVNSGSGTLRAPSPSLPAFRKKNFFLFPFSSLTTPTAEAGRVMLTKVKSLGVNGLEAPPDSLVLSTFHYAAFQKLTAYPTNEGW